MKKMMRLMMGAVLACGLFLPTAKAQYTNLMTYAFTLTNNTYAGLPACTIEVDIWVPLTQQMATTVSGLGVYYFNTPKSWRMIRSTDLVTLVDAPFTNRGSTSWPFPGSAFGACITLTDITPINTLSVGGDNLGSPGSYNGYTLTGFYNDGVTYSGQWNWSGSSIPSPLPPFPPTNTSGLANSMCQMNSNGVPVGSRVENVGSDAYNARAVSLYFRPTNTIGVISANFRPSITFVTEPGVRYQPQWAPVLNPNAWTNMGGSFSTQSPQTITVADTNNAPGQAFYRVEVSK